MVSFLFGERIQRVDLDLHIEHVPPPPASSDYGIGAVGAGFIMRDVQLVAYRNAGFNVTAITSRTPEIAHEVAEVRGISRVYDSVAEMLADPAVKIIDIAVPPDQQFRVIAEIVESKIRPRGILAQKPLAMNLVEARKIVEMCERAGIPLAVNQNMRFDHSIRALKSVLGRGYLGEPVFATIEMRAVPHWQRWLQDYSRLTFLNMSVHHLDCFRYLFGNPDSVYASTRTDPRTRFQHQDGICLYILEYDSGFRASGWDDIWAGPTTPEGHLDPYIKWRVEGTEGVAEGLLGWPKYPNHEPSTIRFSSLRFPGTWIAPRWREAWFPDAFQGPMAALMDAIARGIDPENSGADNLRTMALIEACYRSVSEKRSVRIAEVLDESLASASRG
jgi:predicted dehydrogenase